MKRYFFISFLFIFIFLIGFAMGNFPSKNLINTSSNIQIPAPRPLDRYAINHLENADIPLGYITISDMISSEDGFTSYKFSFEFSPNLEPEKLIKKTSGQINVPINISNSENNKYPVVVMIRGYVDQESYQTGIGSKNAATFFADNGFITIALDFLGYADSDSESSDIFESRFQTYTTVLTLLKTLENTSLDHNLIKISDEIDKSGILNDQLNNHSTISVWGHSNGGQIALTILEITKGSYPTVLWAPVSKPFPYSILYYTDESEDRGKLIRRELAKFEQNYDVELYSLTNYLNDINAPIQIHQGTVDDAVLFTWSDELVTKLKELGKNVTYFKYAGADHNLKPSWDTVVQRDLEFFQKQNK
jgi:alpha-beta hydrolase superfamily lysophospholipase